MIGRSPMSPCASLVLVGVLVALLLQRRVAAWPLGAGSCVGGEAATTPAPQHMEKPTVDNSSIALGGYQVLLDSIPLDPAIPASAAPDVHHVITVRTLAAGVFFRGILIRLEGPFGVDVTNLLDIGAATQIAGVCSAPVAGVTHFNASDKTEATASLFSETPIAPLTLEITLVRQNDATLSQFYYSAYTVNIEEAGAVPLLPTSIPTQTPMAIPGGTVPPTAPPTPASSTGPPTFAPIPFQPPPPVTVAPAFDSPCNAFEQSYNDCFQNDMSTDDSVVCGNCLNSALTPDIVQEVVNAGRCSDAADFLCTTIWACQVCGPCIADIVGLHVCEMQQLGLPVDCTFDCPSPPPTIMTSETNETTSSPTESPMPTTGGGVVMTESPTKGETQQPTAPPPSSPPPPPDDDRTPFPTPSPSRAPTTSGGVVAETPRRGFVFLAAAAAAILL